MKTHIRLIICIVFCSIVCLTSCKKQPIACIDASTTTPYTGETISFDECSVDAVSWEWTFPDGQVLAGPKVDYTFNTPGLKTVTLEAFSKKRKKSDITSTTVQVTQSTGKVSFWQSGTPAYDYTNVTVNGSTKTISIDMPVGVIGCSIMGCANFTLDVGTYSYYAEEQSFPYTSWSGTFAITNDGCTKMQL